MIPQTGGMNLAQWLPHANATLNLMAATALVAARWRIHHRDIDGHRRWMLAALGISALFLAGYLAYHVLAPIRVFRGEGWIRPVYYVLLVSHVLMAALSLPMILASAWFGWRDRRDRHRRWVRWTWPAWMYVSVTGVFVYALLWHAYP